MRKSTQLIAAVAVAGIAIAGSTALTGTGLANAAGSSQFIGGTVSQSVSGGSLASVVYSFGDGPANTMVNFIDLRIDGNVNGHLVSVVATGGPGGQGTFTCAALNVSGQSHCTYAPAASEWGYSGLSNLAITVSGSVVPA